MLQFMWIMHSEKQWYRRECNYFNRCLIRFIKGIIIIIIIIIIIERLILKGISYFDKLWIYEGWNFNSGNYLFTTDTK
jgi:hypothetical protein